MGSQLLVIGHSHIECLRRAAKKRTDVDVKIVSLKFLKPQPGDTSSTPVDLALAVAEDDQPSAVCLCLVGNHHNMLGMVEHPVPFSIGSPDGAAPQPGDSRQFIPYSVMRANMNRLMRSAEPAAKRLYESFPDAKRLYLNAPPPMANWEHIQKYPGTFADKLHLGPSPKPLRAKLYEVQSDVMRDLAERHDATFVEISSEAMTDDGFLADEFYNEDPTHGNDAYGAIMLDRIIATAGLTQ